MSELAEFAERVRASLVENEALRITLAIEAAGAIGSDTKRVEALPGLLPLWSDGTVHAGLMALPDRSWRNWPGVLVQGDQALTSASTSATLLPNFMVQRYLSNFPDEAKRLAAGWGGIERSIATLHQALEGTPDSLAALEEALLDRARRARFKYRRESAMDFEEAHSELGRAIERSSDFDNFAQWFDERRAGSRAPVRPEIYGNWARLALGWAFIFDSATPTGPQDPDALIPLLTEHAGWDTCLAMPPTWSQPNRGASDAFASQLAGTISYGAALNDPVEKTLVKAISSKGTAYDGLAHAEAVPVLDERGEPIRAWGALMSAAWWMWRRFGSTPAAITRGALQLVADHGWDDISWVIDHGSGADQ